MGRDHHNRYDLRQGADLLSFNLRFETAEIWVHELAVKLVKTKELNQPSDGFCTKR